jgi:hypothetical protein
MSELKISQTSSPRVAYGLIKPGSTLRITGICYIISFSALYLILTTFTRRSKHTIVGKIALFLDIFLWKSVRLGYLVDW